MSRKRFISILRTLACAWALFALGFFTAYMHLARISDAREQILNDAAVAAFEPFWQALALIETRYVDAMPLEALAEGAISGLVAALEDPHSAYLHSAKQCDAATNFSGEFSGIGVMARLDEATGLIMAESVIADSPAAKAGVLPGDTFHAVDGLSVVGMSQAELSTLVPGPRGSVVTVVFRRGEQLLTFELTRDIFNVPNVTGQIVGDDIAYIAMLDFNDLTRAQLDAALEAMRVNDRKGLILDLRNNPGGTLASAIEIGSAFVDSGVIVRQTSRDAEEELTYADGSYASIEAPVVLLIDATSASAAEVIAGALQDHGVAALIGETTYGKGTVQTIERLTNGSCLRLTIKRWLRPNGEWIHERGVTPDIVVEAKADSTDRDAQLQAAMRYLDSLQSP